MLPFSTTCVKWSDMILNGSIAESEIIDAIENLKKNDNAAGIDNFVNEYFYAQPILI